VAERGVRGRAVNRAVIVAMIVAVIAACGGSSPPPPAPPRITAAMRRRRSRAVFITASYDRDRAFPALLHRPIPAACVNLSRRQGRRARTARAQSERPPQGEDRARRLLAATTRGTVAP